jgi:Fe-S-cluster containining protein
MSRCTGHCCKRFTISTPYEKLQQDPDSVKDGRYILDMLISLNEEGVSVYTCRHFDKEGGNCSAYEQRPRMCSEHPMYGKKCNWLGCTLSPNPPAVDPIGR